MISLRPYEFCYLVIICKFEGLQFKVVCRLFGRVDFNRLVHYTPETTIKFKHHEGPELQDKKWGAEQDSPVFDQVVVDGVLRVVIRSTFT